MSASVVILGTGLAAYTLARELRKLDSSSELLLVSRDGGGFYAKPTLSNALANNKTPAQLQIKSVEQMAAELQAEIRPRCAVTGIDPQRRQIILADDSRLAYERLVIACGADPFRPPMEGDGAGEVQTINDLDDYSRFHAGLENAKSVAVIGAGLIGCEFANDLATRQIKTSLIDPAAWPLSRLLPEAAGQQFTAGLQARGINFCFGTSVKGAHKTATGYRLELADGRQMSVDRILSAIGLRPRTALAQQAGIACQRGIVANRLLETSSPGIYAMGDCAEIAGLNLPFVLPIMHQARALARTLTGTPTTLCYPAMPVVVKTPACPTVVCPPAPGAEGTWQCQSVTDGLEARFLGPAGELLGFALLGSATAQTKALAAQLPVVLA
jgi:rubredoxin-NAD+ reductase